MVVLVRREGIINFHDESVIHVRQQVSKNYDKEKKKNLKTEKVANCQKEITSGVSLYKKHTRGSGSNESII